MNEQHASLTDAEFDRLGAFLEACGPDAMNLEMLDGFFTALVCGPDLMLPSEFLPEILGQRAFESIPEAEVLFDLLWRHWASIALELLHICGPDEVYAPFLHEDEQGRLLGNDWARGFIRVVEMNPTAWQELLPWPGKDDSTALLLPMLWLAHEHAPDSAHRPPALTLEQRDELLALMVGSVTLIYQHFSPLRDRAAAAQEPTRRAGPKVGRNDPCPCGSGRKFKHCCGKR